MNGAAIGGGTTVVVSYTKGTVLAADTGVLESFVDQAVTNNVPAAAPTFASAATNVAGTTLTITFNKNMADPVGKHAEFSFKVNGTPRSFSAAALDGDNTKINLTVNGAAIGGGTTVLVSYTKGTVLAADTGVLESFRRPGGNQQRAKSNPAGDLGHRQWYSHIYHKQRLCYRSGRSG